MVSCALLLLISTLLSQAVALNLRAAAITNDDNTRRDLIFLTPYCGFPLDMDQSQLCANVNTEQKCRTSSIFTQLPCLWENNKCESVATSSGDDKICPLALTSEVCATISFIGTRKCIWKIPPTQPPSHSPSSTPSKTPTEVPSVGPSSLPTADLSISPSTAQSETPSTDPTGGLIQSQTPSCFSIDMIITGNPILSPATATSNPTSTQTVVTQTERPVKPTVAPTSSPIQIPNSDFTPSVLTIGDINGDSSSDKGDTPKYTSSSSKPAYVIAGASSAGGIFAIAVGIFWWRRAANARADLDEVDTSQSAEPC